MNKDDFNTSGIGAKKLKPLNAEVSILTELKTVSFEPIKNKESTLCSKIKMNAIFLLTIILNNVTLETSEKRINKNLSEEDYNKVVKFLK